MRIVPYITFPIVKACQLRCTYCSAGGAGEASGSFVKFADPEQTVQIAQVASTLGVTKFRITGGEPFLHPKLGLIARSLASLSKSTVTINTNGIDLRDSQEIVSCTPENVKFVVSLDTLCPTRFRQISGGRGDINAVLANIEHLANLGSLKRLNMVVTQANVEDVQDMINYCSLIGCDLKVSDVAEALSMNGDLNSVYASISRIEAYLSTVATRVVDHQYSQHFGIPQKIYHVGTVAVTIKNSFHGARHSLAGPCQKCVHYPCEEGLYFVYAMSDGTYSACRKKGYLVDDDGDTLKTLRGIMDTISRTEKSAGSRPAISAPPIALSHLHSS